MKKLLGIVVLGFILIGPSFAADKKNFTGNYVETICVDGYKFVIYGNRNGPSMVQAFEDNLKGSSVPAKCY